MTIQKVLLIIATIIFAVVAVLERNLLAAGMAFFAASFIS